jgi:hypothetical protein
MAPSTFQTEAMLTGRVYSRTFEHAICQVPPELRHVRLELLYINVPEADAAPCILKTKCHVPPKHCHPSLTHMLPHVP